MKCFFVCVLLLVSLTACMGPSAPGGGSCSNGVCVKIRAAEPIRFGEPVLVTIAVTNEKDISDLGVSLYLDADVVVEGPQEWEKEAKNSLVYKGGAGWKIAAKANQPYTAMRKVHFPPREGLFTIVASASTPSLRVVDSIVIYLTRAGGKVYLSGTPVPIPGWTPGQPIPAVTFTPGPSPTFIPTPTREPSPLATATRPLNP
jgi:hypothetical protein